MNADLNSMILQSEIHYRAQRATKAIARRRRMKQLKQLAARKLS